jgi:hypothetical protein
MNRRTVRNTLAVTGLAGTAVRLDEDRTDVLRGLDLRGGPLPAVRQVHRELDARRDEHEIVPRQGTIRRERDGQPGSLFIPGDYPLLAQCFACGRTVRCDSYLLGGWFHTDEDETA